MDATTQAKRRPQPALLADALAEVMEAPRAGLAPRYEAASRIRSLWVQLVPPELAQHCRVSDLSAGLLTVEADSPSYMYELRISSQTLLGCLRESCPSVKVRAIKVTLTH